MRGLLNSVVILFILATLAIVAYFVHQRQAASYRGDSYSFAQAPVDLVDEFTDFFSSNESPQPTPVPEKAQPERSKPVQPVQTDRSAEYWQEGRKLYLAGDYVHALEFFLKSRTRSSGRPDPMESNARLFQALLGDDPTGLALKGPPQALIVLPGGEPFYAEVVSEDDDEITFKRPDGIGARVRKNTLRDLTVARTPAEKRKLAELEYQRRHTALEKARDYLELGRFCHGHDLCDHLTYVMERGIEAPGDAYEAALFAEYQSSRATTGKANRADQMVVLMKQFYRGGNYTRTAVLDTLPTNSGRPGIAAVAPGGAGGKGPSSGIGGSTLQTPRSTDPEINALLLKADAMRKEADEHYVKAMPGQPDRASHRDKALKLYKDAIGIYEQVQERWGVGLDSIFKDMLTKRYGLLKDMPVR